MPRWLVQLSGDRFDLEEFPRWFPDGDVYAVEESGAFYLVGPAFDNFDDVDAVLNRAGQMLDRFTATILLLWPALRKPTITSVVREIEGGRRDTFAMLSSVIAARSKAGGTIASLETASGPPKKTQAQEILDRASGKPHLEEALKVWADPLRIWPRLYRVLEEIERYLGMPVDHAGICSDNERERFTRSADRPETAGLDARHASGGSFRPHPNPMSLPEATQFIGQILLRVLQGP